jgi:hypothetical protein
MSKRSLGIIGATVLALSALAAPAAATKPQGDPGCFGRDRSYIIHEIFMNGGPYDTAVGGSDVGAELASRAGTNSTANAIYKAVQCGEFSS